MAITGAGVCCSGQALLVMLAFHTGVLLQVLAVLRPIHPGNAPGKALEDNPCTWAPPKHPGDMDEVPVYWLRSGLAVGLAAIWESEPVNRRSIFLSLPTSLLLCLQINKDFR